MIKKRYFQGDVWLLVIVVILSALGVVFVHSASYYNAKTLYGDSFYFTKKQFVGFLVGALAMILTARIDFKKYFGKGKIMLIVSLILLALVFVPFLSVEVYGAKRWLNLGFFTIQPSEFAKFSLVFFCAEYFAFKPERIKTFKGILLPVLVGASFAVLIILEPNMSITVALMLVLFAVLFASGMKMKHFLILVIPFLAFIPILIILEPYRLKRLTAFLNPFESPKGEGYQLLQSLYGISSGSFFGVGLFSSRQKYRFLPFSESDFILSIIAEELGFFGTAILFALMFIVVFKGIKISSKSKSFYGFVLSIGITSVYAVQVILNALVVTGSIPPTGLPLPLISSGNTSIIVFMASFGVLYNLSKSSFDKPL